MHKKVCATNLTEGQKKKMLDYCHAAQNSF